MAYATGQITLSNTPRADLLVQVETLLTTHTAWSFVEEHVDGSWTFRIWKNSGLENSWGQDFYIAFGLLSSNETLYCFTFEVWDDVGKLGIRGCPNRTSNLTPEETYASYGGDTGYPLSNSTAFGQVTQATNTTDFDWYCLVTKDVCIVNVDTSNNFLYNGLFESFVTDHPQEFPITSSSVTLGSCSRRPAMGGTYMTNAFNLTFGFWTQAEGTVPTGMPLHGNKSLGARTVVIHGTGTGGLYRGLLYHVLRFNTDAAVEVGDTITVGNVTYVYADAQYWLDTTAD